MSWSTIYPVLDQIVTLVATPLALIGLYYTWREAQKASTAAEAARDAAASAQAGFSRSSLVILAAQMERVEAELEAAITGKSRELTGYWLGVWRFHASQAAGHLTFLDATTAELDDKISRSIQICGDAKNSLVGTTGDLTRLAKPGLKSVTSVTADLGRVSAMQTLESGGTKK